jgi:general secretion pathway protein C
MDVLLKKYFWLLNLGVIALCASLSGATASHLLEQNWLLSAEETQQAQQVRPHLAPPPERTRDKDDALVIKRNLFCSQCEPVVEAAPADTPEDVRSREILKSTLSLELVATMWFEDDPRWSMAVIRDTGSKEKDAVMYNAGKFIGSTQVKVVRVDPRKVYLRNNNRYEFLEIEGEARKAPVVEAAVGAATGTDADVQRGVRCNGANCDVDRSLLDKLLANTTELATSARFVPSVKDGRPNGFKLYAIRPTSIFGKIGLQNGDTIKSINGMEMASPDQALSIYSKLRTASHLTVSLERRGETTTLDYTIR